ncbi:MAG TPA: hypothetical protein VGW10_00845 [Solirubrobacteraceae bacterium]|nr:hypothetical protein [Solirubrobacteraceae bacterium]
MLGRLTGAWRELDRDQRWAGLASLALLVTLFLPWYQATVIDRGRATNPNFSAFGVFSFVEAAIFLVALGVFGLLFARGERRAFHLPGGDGTVIFGAGLWASVLLLWRVFDRPDIERAVSDGITWGFFFAFLAAAALAATGWKLRAAGRPEPPLLRADEGEADYGPRSAAPEPKPRRRRPPAPARDEQLTLDDAEAATRVEPHPAIPPPPDTAETRIAPREREAEDAPPPPSPEWPTRRRPFDVEADDDAGPLRPGEIPRSPDR